MSKGSADQTFNAVGLKAIAIRFGLMPLLLLAVLGTGCSNDRRPEATPYHDNPADIICLPKKIESMHVPIHHKAGETRESALWKFMVGQTRDVLWYEGFDVGSDAVVAECARQLLEGPPPFRNEVGILEDPYAQEERVVQPEPDYTDTTGDSNKFAYPTKIVYLHRSDTDID